ncbi:cysteine--tRNA ligase, partial [Arthrobacter sp.]|uniref:cysteine--tRNA ligase n=1 Tax=Arthrobacter sp. TaxID=1667 RepID=UPI00258CD08B
FDVLQRWLRHSGYQTTFIRNVTDIDDKILAKSAEQGRPWYNLAYDMHTALTSAYASLNVAAPTYEPLATGHVPEMVELIGELIERGHAYAASGDVYFDVRSWAAYGSLTRQGIDDMEAAADADPRGKRDPRDFALWKGHKPGDPETAAWDSPWGRGRPGWHLECSAMVTKYLGPRFDIHGGGLDLRFPHHENELAQSTAAGDGFANFWMHNGMVTYQGEKMSKSIGNTVSPEEMLAQASPRVVRYYLGQAQYRSVLDYNPGSLAEAASAVERIDGFISRALRSRSQGNGTFGHVSHGGVPEDFAKAMDDDLNVPQALAVLHETVRAGNAALAAGDAETVRSALDSVLAMTRVLGLDDVASTGAAEGPALEALDALVTAQLEARAAARAAKDWAASDAIRDALTGAGVVVEDGPQGASWSLRQD